jgi:O-antigen/teichoic acid export membrane protein
MLTFGLSLDSALLHHSGRYPAERSALGGIAVTTGVSLGLMASATAMATYHFAYSDSAGAHPAGWIYLCMLAIPFLLVGAHLSALLRGTGHVIEAAVVNPVNAALSLILVAIMATLGASTTTLVVGWTAASVGAAVIAIGFAIRSGIVRRLAVERRILSSLSRYGLRTHLGSVLQAANYRLDLLLVAALLGVSEAGVYSIAVAVTEVLWLLPNFLGALVGQRAAVLSDEASASITIVSNRMVVAIAAVGALLAGALYPFGLPAIFGNAFQPAVVPALVLLPGTIGVCIWKILINDLVGRGVPHPKSVTAGVATVAMVALDLALIPLLGLLGAAIASSVAYLFSAILAIRAFRRAVPVRRRDLLLVSGRDMRRLLRVLCPRTARRSNRI